MTPLDWLLKGFPPARTVHVSASTGAHSALRVPAMHSRRCATVKPVVTVRSASRRTIGPASSTRRSRYLPAWGRVHRPLRTPAVAEGAEHVYHQYTIRISGDRDGFGAALKDEYNIGSGVYYPIPDHRFPSLNRTEDLLNTEIAAREVLSLPVHPSLDDKELERIVSAVNKLAGAGA